MQKVKGDAAKALREQINSDLERKPSGVSDSDWSEFKHRRQTEREQLIRDSLTLKGETV